MEFRESLLNYMDETLVDELINEIESGKITHALLLNTKKLSDEDFIKYYPNVKKHPFVEHAYLYSKEEYDFGKMLFYDNGVYSIEDASAMMVNYFLKPNENDVVLDICAAPGNKAIGASLMMNDEGIVVANDISYPRAKAMSQNIERMGRGNMIASSSDFIFSHISFTDCFTKIIVDAPCSGSAMIRKNDLAKADWKYEKVKLNARRQMQILSLAYKMLKPGGYLSYSTCSFSGEENEDVILDFLENHKDMHIVDLQDNEMFYRPKKLKESIYLLPNKFPGEGQYIAILKKDGEFIPPKKEFVTNSRYKNFLEEFNLSNRSNEEMRGKFYSISQHFDVSHLNVLRYGVKLFEMRPVYIPDHHLAHFLSDDYSIKIEFENAKKYIHGDSFEINKPDGFYIVSYRKQNLGFVKCVNGIAKNHYPKGLRREINKD